MIIDRIRNAPNNGTVNLVRRVLSFEQKVLCFLGPGLYILPVVMSVCSTVGYLGLGVAGAGIGNVIGAPLGSFLAKEICARNLDAMIFHREASFPPREILEKFCTKITDKNYLFSASSVAAISLAAFSLMSRMLPSVVASIPATVVTITVIHVLKEWPR